MVCECIPFLLACNPVNEDCVKILDVRYWRKKQEWCTDRHYLGRGIFPAINALDKVEASTFFTVEVHVIIEIYEILRGDALE